MTLLISESDSTVPVVRFRMAETSNNNWSMRPLRDNDRESKSFKYSPERSAD
jgi:hypothetical protein